MATGTEPVDMVRLREASLEDEEFMVELIELYLGDMPAQFAALHQAAEQKDTSQAAAMAHRIKGSSGNVGATALANLCDEVELLRDSGAADRLPGLLESIEKEWTRVQESLVNLKNGVSVSGS